ncbi:MAG: restriction endonuclease [Verrucomicrobiaceae bacterium]|nr:MAG: restriction endonuclease [Verrucomicrobiaceae bacterium]
MAAKAIGPYEHDAGISCQWGVDFVHGIPVDPSTLVEFDRLDPNVIPTVNLRPRARYQQVYAKQDFFASLENLRTNRVILKDGDVRERAHLREKAAPLLSNLTRLIHETHHGKNLERLFAPVFRKMPNVVDVIENGFGWGTDHGADLIVTLQNSFGNLQLERKIVVQLKSYSGNHYELSGVEQIVNAINKFGADAGMIVTTAEPTEQLEEAISERAANLGKPIGLIAGKDVAQFILEHHPNLLFSSV